MKSTKQQKQYHFLLLKRN